MVEGLKDGLLVGFRDEEIVGFTVGLAELGELVGVNDLLDGEAVFGKLGMAEDGVNDGDFVGANVGPDVVGRNVVGYCVGL